MSGFSVFGLRGGGWVVFDGVRVRVRGVLGLRWPVAGLVCVGLAYYSGALLLEAVFTYLLAAELSLSSSVTRVRLFLTAACK